MTNEFAIKVLTELRGYGDKFANIGFDRKEALDLAIKALEQDDVLDKIRAEIMQVANEEKVHDEKWALGLRYATKIIDKYKAESEDAE